MNFYRKEANAVVLNEVDVKKFWTMFIGRLTGTEPDEAIEQEING